MDRPHILFDIIPADWENVSSEMISQRVIGKLYPGGIILFHDADRDNEKGDRSNTVKSLPEIIENAKKQGYQFLTVTKLLKENHDR